MAEIRTMQLLFHSLLRGLLSIISGTRKEDRIVIFGVRRSGNHALTNWLANAVEESHSTLLPLDSTPPLSHCFVNEDGSVVHFNELNELSFRASCILFLKCRKVTKKSSKLLISFEDIRPSQYANFRRLSGKEIVITRDALEVISSRFHNINQKAQHGIGWSRQSCDDYFMRTLQELHENQDLHSIQWHYNKWLNDSLWRKTFLSELGLDVDIMPVHSSVGGGSSFHGTTGKLETDLNERMSKVQPQLAWVAFLKQCIAEYPQIFTPLETEAAQQFISEKH